MTGVGNAACRWGEVGRPFPAPLGTSLTDFAAVTTRLGHYRVHRNCSVYGEVGRQRSLPNPLKVFQPVFQKGDCFL